jgi:hypothetical protein
MTIKTTRTAKAGDRNLRQQQKKTCWHMMCGAFCTGSCVSAELAALTLENSNNSSFLCFGSITYHANDHPGRGP